MTRLLTAPPWCRLVAAAVLAGGCASQPAVRPAPVPRNDLVVVVPSPDGTVGAVTVTHGGHSTVLDRAYASARIPATGRLESGRTSEREIRQVFADALAAQPLPPRTLTFYFAFGTDELTPESRASLAQLAAEIARRPAAEIVVIGHTDRVGTLEHNDALSLQRAERMRQEIVKQLGISPDRITTAGRGEREPLVSTADEVGEPRNRRVEITIR